jgi:integrase
MAAIQKRKGSYRILFRHLGKQHAFTLGEVSDQEAATKASQVDYLLMRLRQRLLTLPDGVDIVSFVEHDGNPPAMMAIPEAAKRRPVTLGILKTRYLETHANGTIETNTLDTCRIHLRHVCRVLGEGLPVSELTLTSLQEYVNRQTKEEVRPVTVRKELSTLRAAWNWGELTGLTGGKFPNRGLRYPKGDEKPPFMTREQILRQIEAGVPAGQLWDSLYLQGAEVAELLAHVEEKADLPWLHPLVCFAAHTGARRSEILRALVADIDFKADVVTIREKKRSNSERTSRRVPLTPFMRNVLEQWLKTHPGGSSLFCHAGEMSRSKKRSRLTGYTSGEERPTTSKGRKGLLSKRPAVGPATLTRNEVHHHLKAVLKESKWEVVRGLHTLRHSFISACASKGVDQRLVQEWCGHMNEVTSRRYRHLWPSTQADAIKKVFA